MHSHNVPQSLIPYLDSKGSRISFRITLRPEHPETLDTAHNPFLTLNETGPLSRMFEAQCLTDAGSRLMRVFLLVQRDRYLLPKTSLWSLNNRDIDALWKKAFDFYSRKNQPSPIIVLSGDPGGEGTGGPWRSLFYCKRRDRFFHPLCPACGGPLEQCTQDDVLTASGLQPYSSTLRRYLFCPACHSAGGRSDFYVHNLEEQDPPTLKDRRDLVGEFRKLLDLRPEVDPWPCFECPDIQECYLSGDLALSRISPFAFYPFRMLIFEAMSLHALDFLALVAGAEPDELERELTSRQEPGRAGRLKDVKGRIQSSSPFFFDRDDRGFLEILYLKLSFLSQVVEGYPLKPDFQQHPAMGLSLDHFWVRLDATESLLPCYWNFKVAPIDIGNAPPPETPLSPGPGSQGLYTLGIMGFQTLLGNCRQGPDDIRRYLTTLINEDLSDDASSEIPSFQGPLEGPLSPENVFWNPDGKAIREGVYGHWKDAVGFFWSLLGDSFKGHRAWSRQSILSRLSEMAGEVKRGLFEIGVPMEETETPWVENRAICAILARIAERWRNEAGAPPAEPPREPSAEEGATSPTVAGPGGEAVPSEFVEEPLEKTTIFSLDTLEPGSPEGPVDKDPERTRGHTEVAGEPLEKTTIFSLDGGETRSVHPEKKDSGNEREGQEDSPVSRDKEGQGSHGTAADPPGPEPPQPEPLLETTIVSLDELEKMAGEKSDD